MLVHFNQARKCHTPQGRMMMMIVAVAVVATVTSSNNND